MERIPTLRLTPFARKQWNSLRAQRDITALKQREDLVQISDFGAPLTLEMIAENVRRTQEFDRLWAEIIKRYGVRSEFLQPLRDEENDLRAQLKKVRAKIALLRR